MKDLRIIFMGTPDFAVASLDILVQNNYNIVAVITAPDKPAGRGQQLQQSAVKKYALEKGLTILQPEKLKSEDFINQLKELKADLQIVVAFRMLPEIVWNMPPIGTFNLHASLLPQYRGAAPINWAVINGEKESGVTTFFLQHEIDTGKIIFQEKVSIGENETAGELHDKLMILGANLVLSTVKAIEENKYDQIDQSKFYSSEIELKHAPKIFKEDCKVNWNKPTADIYNLIRGLSPYPTAFSDLISPNGQTYSFKIFKTQKENNVITKPVGAIDTDGKTYLKIATLDGYISVLDLQLAGKKRMSIPELLRGFSIDNTWKVA